MERNDGSRGVWKSVSMVLFGIVIGCTAATVQSDGSTAHAEATRAPAWEHKCMGPSMSISGINDDVKQAGSEGWELATMWEGIVCFKRPAGGA